MSRLSFQVELLFRRALNDPDGLYTLAFADEIDYNISEQSFRKLEELLKENREISKWPVYDGMEHELEWFILREVL